MLTITILTRASRLSGLDRLTSILLWIAKLISLKYIFDYNTSNFLVKTLHDYPLPTGKSFTSSARSIGLSTVARGTSAPLSDLSTHTLCPSSLPPSLSSFLFHFLLLSLPPPSPSFLPSPFFAPFLPSVLLSLAQLRFPEAFNVEGALPGTVVWWWGKQTVPLPSKSSGDRQMGIQTLIKESWNKHPVTGSDSATWRAWSGREVWPGQGGQGLILGEVALPWLRS